jgi:hypothetical protein
MLAPTVEAVAEQYATPLGSLLKHDNPLSHSATAQGHPTLILFRGGKEEERVVGATSKEAVLNQSKDTLRRRVSQR